MHYHNNFHHGCCFCVWFWLLCLRELQLLLDDALKDEQFFCWSFWLLLPHSMPFKITTPLPSLAKKAGFHPPHPDFFSDISPTPYNGSSLCSRNIHAVFNRIILVQSDTLLHRHFRSVGQFTHPFHLDKENICHLQQISFRVNNKRDMESLLN